MAMRAHPNSSSTKITQLRWVWNYPWEFTLGPLWQQHPREVGLYTGWELSLGLLQQYHSLKVGPNWLLNLTLRLFQPQRSPEVSLLWTWRTHPVFFSENTQRVSFRLSLTMHSKSSSTIIGYSPEVNFHADLKLAQGPLQAHHSPEAVLKSKH